MITLKKILLTRPDHLGDVILSLPVAESLKKNIPGCRVHYLASPYTAAIAPMAEYVDGWVPDTNIDGRRLSITQLAGIIATDGYDCLIELKPSWRTAAAEYLSAVKLRIGTSRRAYSFFYSVRVAVHRKASGYHQTDLDLMHLGPLGITDILREPRLQVTENGTKKAGSLLSEIDRSFVVIHPGSGGSSPNWPLENYRQLSAMIKDELNYQIVITNRDSVTSGFEDCIDLGGKTDLEALAGVISRAAIFISGSTGPLHLADALGAKCVSLFVNRPDIGPVRWGPRRNMENVITPAEQCRCTNLNECHCLERIAPTEVINRVKRILENTTVTGAKKN